ncbi:MAG: sulfurtransferase [Pseudomonadota bacterium]
MLLTTLVDVHTLAKHLDDPNWVVVDCRFALSDPDKGYRSYLTSHVPGARYAHLNQDLSSPITPSSGRHPLPDAALLTEKLGAWGIDNRKQVVVYDDTFGAMASRLWWLLRWLGHRRCALLDGGFPRWQREKLSVTAELPKVQPARFMSAANHSLVVDANEVMRALAADDRLILDARAEERFTGDVEPLDKVAGHIPGAVNAPYEDNLDFSGEFMSDEALREHYGALLAGRPADEVIVMCGSGVTACHNLVALEHAGLTGAKLYAGSWSEWITDPKRPVAKGV